MYGAWAKPLLRKNSGMLLVVSDAGCSRCFGKGDMGQFFLEGLRDDLVIVNRIVVGDMLNLDLKGGIGIGALGGLSIGCRRCSRGGLGAIVSRVGSSRSGEKMVKAPSDDVGV